MTNPIQVYTRNRYGNEDICVVDSDLARTLAALTRMKTLLPEHVRALQTLGFTFERVPDPAKSLGADLFALGVSMNRAAAESLRNPQA